MVRQLRVWQAESGGKAVFRYKTILGQRVRSRSPGNRRVEVKLACKILNTMTSLGMPDSVKVE